MRIRLDIEYDGTDYCGWQRQKNGITIQECVENAVKKATGKKAAVHGSGRTDAGVHAKCQTAHFDTESRIPPERFAFALNYYLPEDIRVLTSREVPDDFHARFSATGKTYRYVFRNAPQRSALYRNLCAHESIPMSTERMKKAAAHLAGTHDFASFCAHSGQDKDTVRTISRIDVRRTGEYIILDVEGTGFLHNMVRIIAGTLAEAGKGNLEPEDIQTILEAKDRNAAGPTAPACGLMLVRAHYEMDKAPEEG